MKTLIATLLATAAGSSFAFAPTAALNHDPATYRNMTQKAAADYKAAAARCSAMSGNDKEVCLAEAKAARAHAEADALVRYNSSAEGKARSRARVADADYTVATAKCGAMSGADKDNCLNNAKSVHTAALASARQDGGSTSATGSSSGETVVAGTSDAKAAKAAQKCEQLSGDPRTGCLVQTGKSPAAAAAATGKEVASRAGTAAEHAADKTRVAAATAADKTRAVAAATADKTKALAQTTVEKSKEVAHTAGQKTENAMEQAGDKTRQAASTVAQKTGNAMETAGEKTRDTAATVADKADAATDTAAAKGRAAAGKTEVAAADTAITTKVKANLLKEPDLKSMGIHVETEKGVVMLSGFVDSKVEADKAVRVARETEGVTTVKSAIKLK